MHKLNVRIPCVNSRDCVEINGGNRCTLLQTGLGKVFSALLATWHTVNLIRHTVNVHVVCAGGVGGIE